MRSGAAGAEFTGSLRSAQQQDAEDSDFVAVKVERFLGGDVRTW